MSNPVFKLKDSTNVTELTRNEMINLIAKLQEEKSETDKTIRALKVPVKADMKAKGESKVETPEGHTAVLYDTDRCNADKKEAERRVADPDCGMTAEDYTAIFPVKTCENFKVK